MSQDRTHERVWSLVSPSMRPSQPISSSTMHETQRPPPTAAQVLRRCPSQPPPPTAERVLRRRPSKPLCRRSFIPVLSPSSGRHSAAASWMPFCQRHSSVVWPSLCRRSFTAILPRPGVNIGEHLSPSILEHLQPGCSRRPLDQASPGAMVARTPDTRA
jgi:hypothetical protein